MLSAPALAQEAEVVPIEAGEVAPFSGQLFPTELAVRLGLRVEQLQFRLEMETDHLTALCDAQMQFDRDVLELERERNQQNTELLTTNLERAGQIPWYRTFVFGLIVGVVGSALLVAGGVALIIGVT
jgi:hypothetical protein